MRIITALLVSVMMLMGAASASGNDTPPVLTLGNDGVIEAPVTGNYSWSYPTGNAGEWAGVEACGMAPTDPAVLDTFPQVNLLEEQTYTIDWNGNPPDELIVFSWDTDVFTDQDHIDSHQQNSEIITRKEGGAIILKPDRVYDFQAKWLQSESGEKAYGLANYYLVTLQLIMEDGPGMIMVGGWTPSADPSITDDLKTIFEKGTETLTGAVAVPVAYLGSQVVAGTNHAFLCWTASAYSGIETEPAYVIVYLYEDLQGNVSILNIADFDIGSLCTYGAE